MSDKNLNRTAKSHSAAETRILEAAKRLFLELGYNGVSTDKLCTEAGVSKSSLYKYFGDMSGVLQRLVAAEGDLFNLTLNTQPESASEFRSELIGYGTRLMNLLNEPFCIQLDRVMHEEARLHPDTAESFYDASYGQTYKDLVELIKHAKKQKFYQRSERPEDLADHLMSLWSGLAYTKARLGLVEKPFSKPQARSTQCVELIFGKAGS